jgi:hypothetical protein
MNIQKPSKKSDKSINEAVSFNLPLYMDFPDYHEISCMSDFLGKLVGKKVQYHEFGCDGSYHAVFFLKNQEKAVKNSREFQEVEASFLED